MEVSAKVIAHSKCSKSGKEIVTFELIYPRMILAELNTHRILSKNSASSRAIPIAKVIEAVRYNPAQPVHWGANQPGMSAKEEVADYLKDIAQQVWHKAACNAADSAEQLAEMGLHKQVANRILEPFQWMKTVLTGTEFDNFFYLRNHDDADPNIKALAKAMWEALKASTPVTLGPTWWHVPYFQGGYWSPFHMDEDCVDEPATLDEALAISSSCCAQTSFRTTDDSIEKAERIFERLVESKPVHASPFEHQAKPMKEPTQTDIYLWEDGATHVDRKGQLWSGNFCGFIQHRQLIPDNACWDYKEEL
jgi:hypothetical protein